MSPRALLERYGLATLFALCAVAGVALARDAERRQEAHDQISKDSDHRYLQVAVDRAAREAAEAWQAWAVRVDEVAAKAAASIPLGLPGEERRAALAAAVRSVSTDVPGALGSTIDVDDPAWKATLAAGGGWHLLQGESAYGPPHLVQYMRPVRLVGADGTFEIAGAVYGRLERELFEAEAAQHRGFLGWVSFVGPDDRAIGHEPWGGDRSDADWQFRRRSDDPLQASLVRAVDLARQGASAKQHVVVDAGGSEPEDGWLASAPIAGTGWVLLGAVGRAELAPDRTGATRAEVEARLARVMAWYAVVAALASIAGLGLRALAGVHAAAWTAAAAMATLTLVQPAPTEWAPAYDAHAEYRPRPPSWGYQVPTWVYFSSVERGQTWTHVDIDRIRLGPDASAVVRGRARQDIPADLALAPGLRIESADDARLTLLHSEPLRTYGEVTASRHEYAYEATLALDEDLVRFPFDLGVLGVATWHTAETPPAISIPDVTDYAVVTPSRLPGLSPGAVPAGWTALRSYVDEVPGSSTPGLVVELRRTLVTAVLDGLARPLALAALLWAWCCTLTTDREHFGTRRRGFTRASAGLVALVLATAWCHREVRAAFPGTLFTYIDCWYGALYLLAALAATNAWWAMAPTPPRWLAWGDNRAARLAYWPLLASLVLLATVAYFFPVRMEA
jgi:hypothetical protein